MSDTTALIDTGGGLWYEVRISGSDAEIVARRVGQDVVLYTIHYVEGDPSRGQMTPALIGFLAEADRGFFRVFTTVKGIGVRKALRALMRPAGEIAAAIQGKDAKFLASLPEIGKRTAERIIAELHGKVDRFAGAAAAVAAGEEPMPQAAQQAASVLVQLGEKRVDAQSLVERVLAVAPELDSPEAIIQQVYKIKSG